MQQFGYAGLLRRSEEFEDAALQWGLCQLVEFSTAGFQTFRVAIECRQNLNALHRKTGCCAKSLFQDQTTRLLSTLVIVLIKQKLTQPITQPITQMPLDVLSERVQKLVSTEAIVHASSANKDDAIDSKAFTNSLHKTVERIRISRVTRQSFYRDRTALCITQQTVHNLWSIGAMIATVSILTKA